MQIRTVPDAALVPRLEAQARENPAAYRRKVALWAVCGDVILTTMQALPWIVPAFIGVLLQPIPLFIWAFIPFCLLVIWFVRPNVRMPGRPVAESDWPALYQFVRELQQQVGMRGKISIALDDELNASAFESRGLLGILGTKRVLTLGIPLLASLTREQLQAVIAHEFGHFSRRHGRLGHWLYRARRGWILYAEQITTHDSAFDRSAAHFADWFVPHFSNLSFVTSRQFEYEADADAAGATSSATLAEALVQLHIAARIWQGPLPKAKRAWIAESRQTPEDFLQRWQAVCRAVPADTRAEMLQDALAEQSDLMDTHPCLRERLAAIGESARDAGAAAPCAGESLLGPDWSKMAQEFNTAWRERNSADWAFEHFRLKHVVQPLLEMPAALEDRSQPRETLLWRAAMLQEEAPDRVGAALREWQSRFPEDGRPFYLEGCMRLNTEPEAALGLFKQARKLSPALIPLTMQLSSVATSLLGQHKEAEAQLHAAQTQQTKQAEDCQSVLQASLGSGTLDVHCLDAMAMPVLENTLHEMPAVVSAWAGCKTVKFRNHLKPGETITANILMVIVVIDPEVESINADKVTARVLRYVSSCCPPGIEVYSRQYFCTEMDASDVVEKLSARPGYQLFQRANRGAGKPAN